MLIYIKAVLLAVVEGVTEFLPISSTGHLIIVEELLSLSSDTAFADAFLVMIQFPAILSVVVYFWTDLWPFSGTVDDRRASVVLWSKIFVAVIPAVIFGLLLDDVIEAHLFRPIPVAVALFVGGIVLIVIERRTSTERFPSVLDIGYGVALLIGLFQCLALIPGTSRSAATIIGAMLLGASRTVAAEFSFFLAIPTMLGATAYKAFDHGLAFTQEQWGVLAVGSLTSFVVAYCVIAWLMRFIQNHKFTSFGYYRIGLAIIVLGYFYFVR